MFTYVNVTLPLTISSHPSSPPFISLFCGCGCYAKHLFRALYQRLGGFQRMDSARSEPLGSAHRTRISRGDSLDRIALMLQSAKLNVIYLLSSSRFSRATECSVFDGSETIGTLLPTDPILPHAVHKSKRPSRQVWPCLFAGPEFCRSAILSG